MNKYKYAIAFVGFCLFALAMGKASAADCELSWDASVSANVVKYNIYKNAGITASTSALKVGVSCGGGDVFFITAVASNPNNAENFIESEPSGSFEVPHFPTNFKKN